jgi:hypothetical protein
MISEHYKLYLTQFTIHSGEVLAFLGLVQYYFAVNLSQPMWILIDGLTVPLSSGEHFLAAI